ncbi:MAG: hypothetical protein ACYTEQ_24695 [Planctomycetota bacterium]
MAKRPKYYLPRRNGKATSREIAWWWLRRWVDRRNNGEGRSRILRLRSGQVS